MDFSQFNNKKIAFKDRGNLGTACTVFSRKMHEDIENMNLGPAEK
jgi:hypothetical protein